LETLKQKTPETEAPGVWVKGLKKPPIEKESAFFGVGAAPASGCDLLASKQGAHTGFVASFTLEQGAIATVLGGSMGGVFFGVNFAGFGFVTEGSCLGVVFGNQGICHGKTASQQSSATSADLDNEFATTGHKNLR